MRKYAIVALLTLLYGCSGSSGDMNINIPQSGKEAYLDAGGVGINMVETLAVTPVTVSPLVEGTLLKFTLHDSCILTLDVSVMDEGDADFWVAQPTTLTYDAEEIMCNSEDIVCDYSIEMVAGIAEVALECTATNLFVIE